MEEEKVDVNSLLVGVDENTMKQINLLTTINSFELEEEDNCSICRDAFSRRNGVALIKLEFCKHTFHKHCAIQYFKDPSTNMRCPNCRRHAITGEELNAKVDI